MPGQRQLSSLAVFLCVIVASAGLLANCVSPIRSDHELLSMGDRQWQERLTADEQMRLVVLVTQQTFAKHYKGKRIYLQPPGPMWERPTFRDGPSGLKTRTLNLQTPIQSFVARNLWEDVVVNAPFFHGWWIEAELDNGLVAYLHSRDFWDTGYPPLRLNTRFFSLDNPLTPRPQPDQPPHMEKPKDFPLGH